MKLAFPELTWLEPPSRGKLINELRHGGPVYKKAVSRPQSCRHALRAPVVQRSAPARDQSPKMRSNLRAGLSDQNPREELFSGRGTFRSATESSKSVTAISTVRSSVASSLVRTRDVSALPGSKRPHHRPEM